MPPTPSELRKVSCHYRQAAEKEITREIKRGLAGHAFALAQLAEQMERREPVAKFVTRANIEPYERMLAESSDETQRKLVETLLLEEQAKLAKPARVDRRG
jgi:rubrerythrin